jgi:hypothetical protein
MPAPKNFNGKDLKVVVVGDDHTPEAVFMEKREALDELKSMHGDDAIIYLHNKNLQLFTKRLRGAIVWVERLRVVAAVIESPESKALVRILHPKSQKGETVVIDLRVEGCFLQLVLGHCPLPIDYEFRRREINHETGELVTLVDTNSCIKMNVYGPDIVVQKRSVPEIMKKELKMDQLMTLTTSKLPKPPRLHVEPNRNDSVVPVVYVYRNDHSHFKFVQNYWYVGDKEEKWTPIFSVPIGDPYCDPDNKSSIR